MKDPNSNKSNGCINLQNPQKTELQYRDRNKRLVVPYEINKRMVTGAMKQVEYTTYYITVVYAHIPALLHSVC